LIVIGKRLLTIKRFPATGGGSADDILSNHWVYMSREMADWPGGRM